LPLLRRSATAILLGLAVAGLLGGCGGVESEGGGTWQSKVGGAWPSMPVKCSAYAQDRAQYEACLARDREATGPSRPERREA
jgi:hypothetical protein